MQEFIDRLSEHWCRFFHTKTLRPVKGHYLCGTCGRAYPVPWLEGEDYTRRAGLASPPAVSGFAVLEFQKNP